MSDKRQEERSKLDYSKAGVSLTEADRIAEVVEDHFGATKRPGCIQLANGFAGLFDLQEAKLDGKTLVMGADGVGTKIALALQFDNLDSLGIDLVAMCVNDVLTVGAEPIAFLDYFASGELRRQQFDAILKGVVDGCQQAGCALLGGETAEMPGMYQGGHFDLAGFCVGVVDRKKILDGSRVCAGDVLIGLPSSGVHSNGYSLVRAIVDRVEVDEVNRVASDLLAPTRIYVDAIKSLHAAIDIHAMAHITGGGLDGNIRRVVPKGLTIDIDRSAITVPAIFDWLRDQGNVELGEMYRVFNMGIGFVVLCSREESDKALKILGEGATLIGEVLGA